MKRIVPVYVHCVCLAIATAMTILIIGVHAVDLDALGAAEIVVKPAAVSVAASSRADP
jgi:hypothetical protein